MIRLLEALSETPEASNADADLADCLGVITRDFDLDYYAYVDLGAETAIAASNYPLDWQSSYIANSFFQVDPVVAVARATMRPFNWSAANYRRDEDEKIRVFFTQAAEFGIQSGMTFPIWTGSGSIALLTIASNRDISIKSDDVDPLFAAATIGRLHDHFREHRHEANARRITSKHQEIVCLNWYARGKTFQDIATIERMKYSNVCFHMANARRKLDATTSAQATAVAMSLGLIDAGVDDRLGLP